MANIHISLAAEPVLELFHIPVTNSIFTAWVVSLVLLTVAVLVRTQLKQVPGKLQSVLEMLYGGLLDMMEKVIGRADVARELFPFIITAFLFIVTSNWFGLLPGVGPVGIHEIHGGEQLLVPLLRAPTADLNTVLAMAVTAVIFVQYLGLKYAGPKVYLSKFFNFSSPIYFFVGLIELVSEFTRIISFSFRLFGNIFAGEVLITVIFFLTYTLLPYVAILPLPFFMLEMFVGLVQAFVFCFLTIVFTAIAVAGHGHAEEEHAHHPATPANAVVD